jgi:hypothetical protein
VLDDAWLPEGASTAQLSRGLSAFAADPQFTLRAWQGYLTHEVQESAPFPIAAKFQLTRVGDERRVISAAAAQEAKADRVAAATVHEDRLSPNLRTAAWASREPNLAYDFAQCVLGEFS